MPLLDVQRGIKTTEIIEFVMEECYKCGIPFMFPNYQKKRLVASQELFYCPNGHPQHYCGKTEAQKLKDELELQKQQHQRAQQQLSDTLLDTMNERNKLKQQVKRIHKGVCPCCNRTFVNVQRHMETKHPDVLKK